MGTVYRARHVKFPRYFAIKVLHRSLMQNPKVVKRFEREAELAGRLRHTNVASVVDVGVTDDGLHFMAMEFAAGENLTALLSEEGQMSEARVLDLAKQMCAGLQHAHEVGLIHRDFKPENVIVEQLAGGREVARIVDWGVAIVREDAADAERGDRLTTKGIVVGTPHYMAPEQARGDAIDHRVDLFALGLICYELLCGKLPFEGSGVDVARANLSSRVPAFAERVPGLRVDPVLEGIVMRLLRKDRDERPPSANAARELFELYEHDRASCALALGVELPVEDRRTGAIEELDDSEVTDEPADPERERATDEISAHAGRKRLGLVALAFATVLALILWLGLRDHHAPAHRSVVVTVDAPPEQIALAMADTHADAAKIDPVTDPATPDPALALDRVPKPRPRSGSGASGSGSTSKPPSTAGDAPSAADVAKLYGVTGRELKALEGRAGMDATIDLWPRYRWIRINEWIATPERRTQVASILERLRADIRAVH